MVAIPEQQELTPEQAYALLQDWFAQAAELATAKTAEVLARKRVAGFYFPEPEEGSNRVDLGGGYDLQLTHTVTRSVDEAALSKVTAEDVAKLKLPMDELFEWKPVLKKSAYNKLNKGQTKFIDGLLDIKPSETPSIKIVPAADAEGHAKHKAAAEAASEGPAPLPISTDEDSTQPGEYYKDADGVWWQLDTDEWNEVSHAATLEQLEVQSNTVKPAKKTAGKRRKAGGK